jgi:hypothetical protein
MKRTRLKRHNLTFTEPVSETVQTQVKSGRYKDFSSAVQDAVWNFFLGPPSPFEEYGVTPDQVERAYQKTVREIDQERKAGSLKPWKK